MLMLHYMMGMKTQYLFVSLILLIIINMIKVYLSINYYYLPKNTSNHDDLSRLLEYLAIVSASI